MDTKWFRNKLSDAQLSQRKLALALGLDAAAISLMLRGRREMRLNEAADIARLLGVAASEVLEAAGVRVSTGGHAIPLTGYVDGTGEILRADKGTVQHPGGNLPEAAEAVECCTAGSPLAHMDGWILFTSARPAPTISPEAVGRLAYCQLRNGVLYLGVPKRSQTRGRWDISGPASDVRGVELDWASPVLLIQP